MYVVNEQLDSLDSGMTEVYAFYHSINQPLVSLKENPAEATQAFVCISKGEDNQIRPYVMLFQGKSVRSVIYTPEQEPPANTEVETLETGALEFVESMGFMMDRQTFSSMNAEQRVEYIKNFAPFQDQAVSTAGEGVEADFVDLEDIAASIERVDEPGSESFEVGSELDFEEIDAEIELDMGAGESDMKTDLQSDALIEAEPAIPATSDTPAANKTPQLTQEQRKALLRILASF